MEVIFSNNEKFKSFEMTPNGKIKNCSSNTIKMWMKNNIPTIYDVIANFEQERNSKFEDMYKKYMDYI